MYDSNRKTRTFSRKATYTKLYALLHEHPVLCVFVLLRVTSTAYVPGTIDRRAEHKQELGLYWPAYQFLFNCCVDLVCAVCAMMACRDKEERNIILYVR